MSVKAECALGCEQQPWVPLSCQMNMYLFALAEETNRTIIYREVIVVLCNINEPQCSAPESWLILQCTDMTQGDVARLVRRNEQ